MPANQFGIDMGEVYRTAAAVKGARTQNKLAELSLSEKKQDIAQRPARQAFQNKLTGLRQTASAGGEGAMDAQQSLIALDPENGPKFIEALASMDQTKRDAVKRSVDEMGQMSAYVLQGQTPEEQERRYQLVRQNMPQESQAKMPEVYDPQFMELSLSKAVSMDKLLEAPKTVSAGDKEQQYRLGRKTGEFKKPVKKGAGSGTGKGGLKSGDESLIYKMAAELKGGIFDQQGNITNLDPEARNNVQEIATEASNIFSRGGYTRAGAVKAAAKKFGFNIRTGDEANQPDSTNDPLGLL